MTRYNVNDEYTRVGGRQLYYYREGVDRVLEYIESINNYPRLVSELRWAIKEGII